jgi:hypothetical protein
MTAVRTFGDFGGSGTKAFYFQQTARAFLMEPEVGEINPSRISRLSLGGVSGSASEDSAYVSYGDRTYAVGRLGRIQAGNTGVGLPKSARAVVKALAQIGVVWEKMRESDSALGTYFPLEMGILLPLEQYWKDAEEVRANIRQAATHFRFRDTTLSAQVQKLEILPEGSGIYLSRLLQLGAEGKSGKDQTIVVLMFGHWQLSLLTFDRGNSPVESNSTSGGPGFIEYLRHCATEVPELPLDDPALFNAVLEGQDQIMVSGRSEPINIRAAKEFAHREYWRNVQEFLLKNLPSGEYEIVLAGGAVSRIENELRTFLEERRQWDMTIHGYDLTEQLRSVLADAAYANNPIAVVRLLDAYSGFRWLLSSPKISTTAK